MKRITYCLLLLIAAPLFAQDAPANMVQIPAGDFWMGRTHYFLVDAVGWFERDRQDDFPAHRVFIDSFFIDKNEVTNEEYAKFVSAKGVTKPWHWPGGKIPNGEEKFPVYNVTWYEANDYCSWAGKRLPTEAEWEKAARGGLDRKKYAWGDTGTGGGGEDPDAFAGYTTRGRGGPANSGSMGAVAVGTYPPNGYGLYDVGGNVWEWVNDWYDRTYYSTSPRQNPKGPDKGVYKVMRGGGWADTDERNLMPSFRNYTDLESRASSIGFRCAK